MEKVSTLNTSGKWAIFSSNDTVFSVLILEESKTFAFLITDTESIPDLTVEADMDKETVGDLIKFLQNKFDEMED